MLITIQVWFDVIRFRKKSSLRVCVNKYNAEKCFRLLQFVKQIKCLGCHNDAARQKIVLINDDSSHTRIWHSISQNYFQNMAEIYQIWIITTLFHLI